MDTLKRYGFGIFFLIIFLVSNVIAEKPPSFKFEQDPVPEKIFPGDTFNVLLKIRMAKGNYLYAQNTSLILPDATILSFGTIKTSETVNIKDPEGKPFPVFKKEALFIVPVKVNDMAPAGPAALTIALKYQGCSDTMCYIPDKKEFKFTFSIHPLSEKEKNNNLKVIPTEQQQKISQTKDDVIRKTAERFGLIGILVLAFFGGILTSLTPCVYPMIPVTISVIGAGSSNTIARGFFLSIVYVLGMSIVYASLGVAAAWSGSLFGSYINHPAVRVSVAVVFAILGLSMFDLFFIQTPAAVSSKIIPSQKKGILGVFLVGIASGAVVSPCVGPLLVGLFIYIATLGSKLYGFFIMWCFSLGMGILFIIIGTLSGALKTLPKAGKWMEIIKQLMGLVMFAIAFYYLMPLIDDTISKILIGAFLVGIGIFIGVTLKPESAPMGKNRLLYAGGIFIIVITISYLTGIITGHQITFSNSEQQGIIWLDDENTALTQAEKFKKPMMIDFSADWCKACKDLEKKTFQDPDIVKEAERFITLRIDSTEPEAPAVEKILKKYHVVGLPTLIFTDSTGKILMEKTITEFIPPEKLLDHMRKIN